MKAIHQFIAATILILIIIITATLVSGWSMNLFTSRSRAIVNATETKSACQYAGMYIDNVTYVCGGNNCFSGVPYRINATIENTGSSRIYLSSMFITMSSGESYQISGNTSSLSAGDTETKSFDAIMITADPPLPL